MGASITPKSKGNSEQKLFDIINIIFTFVVRKFIPYEAKKLFDLIYK
jgi:hypothetical protein